MSQNQKSPEKQSAELPASVAATPNVPSPEQGQIQAPEFGGRKGLEATRYGDWEMNGKCVDF